MTEEEARMVEEKLYAIKEILGVIALERSLGCAEYDIETVRKELRKTETKLKEAEAKVAELESCGEGKYKQYINTTKGAVRVFVNEESDSGGIDGNLGKW